MMIIGRLGLALLIVLTATSAYAEQSTVDITQSLLNTILTRVGTISKAGVAQPYNASNFGSIFEDCVVVGSLNCPRIEGRIPGFGSTEIPMVHCRRIGGGTVFLPVGDPVPWQWWVSEPRVTLSANSLKFTAKVTMHIGDEWSSESRTVNANIKYDAGTKALMLDISNFEVYLKVPDSDITLREPPINVAKMYGIGLPIPQQSFSIPLPNGTTRNLVGRVASATASYSPELARVTLNVSF